MIHQPNKDRTTTPPKKHCDLTEELNKYLIAMEDRLYQAGWEQTREILLFIANSNGRKKYKKEDILKLPWDKKDEDEKG